MQNVNLGGERCQEVSLINFPHNDVGHQVDSFARRGSCISIATSPLEEAGQVEKIVEELSTSLAD